MGGDLKSWAEDSHPRDEQGRFTSGGGDAGSIHEALKKRGVDKVYEKNRAPYMPADGVEKMSGHLEKFFGGRKGIDHMEQMVGTGEHTAHVVELEPEGPGVQVKYDLRDKEGNSVAMIQHRYDVARDGTKSMHLQNFFIKEGHQGKGIGEQVMRQTLSSLREEGVSHVSLDAVEVGRYTWPSFGFKPTNPDAVRGRLQAHLEANGVSSEGAKKIVESIGDKWHEAAALRIEGKHVGKEFFLKGANFKARLDLKDGDSGFEHAKARLKL